MHSDFVCIHIIMELRVLFPKFKLNIISLFLEGRNIIYQERFDSIIRFTLSN